MATDWQGFAGPDERPMSERDLFEELFDVVQVNEGLAEAVVG
jgi:hypothetical protein